MTGIYPAGLPGDDVVAGAVRWLSGFDDVRYALGVYTESATPYLYQHELWAPVEGTQQSAAVISYSGGWAPPNMHNTMRFPRLQIDIYTDPIRNATGNVVQPAEARRRAMNVWSTLDRHLHRTGADVVMWGEVRVLGSIRLGEPTLDALSDGDGLIALQCFYGISQG